MTRHVFALIALSGALLAPGTTSAAQQVPISFHAWVSAADFDSGAYAGTAAVAVANPDGTTAGPGGVALASTGASTVTYHDAQYGDISAVAGTWTSPVYRPGLAFTELVASWNADTPSGTWIQVELRGVTDKGASTKWYVMGRWAYGDDTIHRTSVGGQGDANGFVSIDTFFAKDHPLTQYQLRATLYRKASTAVSPRLRLIGAVASDAPNQKPSIPSALGGAEGLVLNVPPYSQEIHAGQYPQYDGGGEAWCSPTSTSMVLAYWHALPPASDWSWVDPSYADPWVDQTARSVFDYHYDGAGNWPFNTAYAGGRGLDAFVTQIRGLNEAEQFIKAGIPLVASVAANPNKLTGFLLDKGTNGHLLVIVGFTQSGDVVVNDPAALSDSTVQRVYNRAEFERAWLPATGGIVYVLRPPGVALPPASGGNW
jgi:Peptidase_C39 like family